LVLIGKILMKIQTYKNVKIYKGFYGYFLGNFKWLYLAHHWPY